MWSSSQLRGTSPTSTRDRCRTLWVEREDEVEALVALGCVFVPLYLMDYLLLRRDKFRAVESMAKGRVSVEQTVQFPSSVVGTICDLASDCGAGDHVEPLRSRRFLTECWCLAAVPGAVFTLVSSCVGVALDFL